MWPFKTKHKRRGKKVPLRVGDKAPKGPLPGAMISVDPETGIITAIFQP